MKTLRVVPAPGTTYPVHWLQVIPNDSVTFGDLVASDGLKEVGGCSAAMWRHTTAGECMPGEQ